MQDCVSVINSGSSSIKFSLYGVVRQNELDLIFRGQVGGIGVAPKFRVWDGQGGILAEQQWKQSSHCDHEYLLKHTIGWIKERRNHLDLSLRGVGHRVVHGGEDYAAPIVVDSKILAHLESFNPLAPLHQKHNISSIRTVMKLSGDVPQIACFDTAFHRTTPPVAQQFALPRRLSSAGVRRYGFHGLSYEYIASRLSQVAPDLAAGKVVVAHLGSGASMCALQGGKSVDSTMGFTALDGLVMGTRPGTIDPGVLLYLLQEKQMGVEELTTMLYKQSGLLGVSGISNDMRILLKSTNPRAEEAISVFLYRIKRELGALVAILGGLDGLVFTAGIGEHSAVIRSRICKQAKWLGLEVDGDANKSSKLRIDGKGSSVSILVIPTNEELMIATHTLRLLNEHNTTLC